jgi:hypothetical protein
LYTAKHSDGLVEDQELVDAADTEEALKPVGDDVAGGDTVQAAMPADNAGLFEEGEGADDEADDDTDDETAANGGTPIEDAKEESLEADWKPESRVSEKTEQTGAVSSSAERTGAVSSSAEQTGAVSSADDDDDFLSMAQDKVLPKVSTATNDDDDWEKAAKETEETAIETETTAGSNLSEMDTDAGLQSALDTEGKTGVSTPVVTPDEAPEGQETGAGQLQKAEETEGHFPTLDNHLGLTTITKADEDIKPLVLTLTKLTAPLYKTFRPSTEQGPHKGLVVR